MKEEKNKREEILEVASRCICKFGLQKTNAQLIATEMKLSQTTIFYYFPKQQMLFDALFDHIIFTGRDLIAQAMKVHGKELSYRDKLWKYIEAQLLWAEKFPHHIGVLMFTILDSAHNSEMHEKVAVALKNGEETIFAILAGGMVEKKLPDISEPKLAALLIHKSLMGCLMDFYLHQKNKKGKEYENIMERVLESLGL